MAKVIFGNHSSVLVPGQDRDGIRKLKKGWNYFLGIFHELFGIASRKKP